VFDTRIGKIGMLVCFDWMFPEAWRKLALQGAQLIAHPSNLVLPYCQSVIPSYSLVNRCYIATANRIGCERNLTFTGQSVLTNPGGEELLKGDTDKSQVLSAEIDLSLADNKYITAKNDAFADRRSEVYGDLNPEND
jgi:predicted amidohydrolase